MRVFGDGRDGGREATCEMPIDWSRTVVGGSSVWRGEFAPGGLLLPGGPFRDWVAGTSAGMEKPVELLNRFKVLVPRVAPVLVEMCLIFFARRLIHRGNDNGSQHQ